MPIPQALLDTIGQTRKFIVKVSDHNLSGKTQTITVTKILPLATTFPATSEEPGASSGFGNSAGDRARKAAEILESGEAKRCKSGWYSFKLSSYAVIVFAAVRVLFYAF